MTYGKTQRWLRLLGTIAALGLVAGCAGYTAKLATITIAPDARVSANGTHQFTADGRDERGAPFLFTPVWSASSGGTIDSSGLYTAGTAPGTNTVTATDGDVSGSASVVVTGPPAPVLARITLTPMGPDTVAAGSSMRFLAAGADSAGYAFLFSPTWSLVAGGGTLDSTGLFTADTLLGTYANTIKAEYAGIAAYATVTVVPSAASRMIADSATANGTMREVVLFGFDQSALSDATRAALDAKVKVFQAHPDMRILIVGHTDRRGTGAYNLALGTRRAQAVRDYLVAQGIASNRIDIKTRGEKDQIGSGDSEPTMALNRRDAFWILAVSDSTSKE
ncbi:MAG TPA: OmpA family protein [Gemmatimonadales bacterium]|nr:OmpA family protein [Gemmatimonadales bacterium]